MNLDRVRLYPARTAAHRGPDWRFRARGLFENRFVAPAQAFFGQLSFRACLFRTVGAAEMKTRSDCAEKRA